MVHGLTAVQIVIDGEDPAQFESLREELLEEFDPQTTTEAHLVEQLAGLLWRLRRVPIFETGLIAWMSHCQDRLHDKAGLRLGESLISTDQRNLPSVRGGMRRNLVRDPKLVGRTLEVILGRRDLLSKISRYEMQLRAQALKILTRLKFVNDPERTKATRKKSIRRNTKI